MRGFFGDKDSSTSAKCFAYGSFLNGRRIHQIFVLINGEFGDMALVLSDASGHCDKNRLFAIGIGAGDDGGVIEGIANLVVYKCDGPSPTG